MSNFWQRTLTGSLFVIVLVLCIISGSWSFFALLFAMNFLCLLEFYKLLLPDKSWFEKYLGVISGSIINLMFAWIIKGDSFIAWYYHLIPVFLLMFIVKLFENTGRELETLAFQVSGILYISFPISMLGDMGYLNNTEYSAALPLGFFILLWTSDTGAYLSGRSLGRTKLFERISPKKTWEGSIGGVLLTLAIAFLLSRFDFFNEAATQDWLIMAVLVVVFGTLGDLFESMLKRNLGIKDSGSLLPGHGGVLDRFDGLFLGVPAVYFYLLLTN